MTQPPPDTEIITLIELSDEEKALVTARAEALGLDMETFIRIRMLTTDLPDPGPFFDLARRLGRFAVTYEAAVRAAVTRQPGYMERLRDLETAYGRLRAEMSDLVTGLPAIDDDGETC